MVEKYIVILILNDYFNFVDTLLVGMSTFSEFTKFPSSDHVTLCEVGGRIIYGPPQDHQNYKHLVSNSSLG